MSRFGNFIGESADRVPQHTKPSVNEKIREAARASVLYHSRHPHLLERRLRALDREWDVERALETGSASLSLLGMFLGTGRNRRWLALPLIVQGFFLQHALQGWCPPLPLFRRLGFRTRDEINHERFALKALRGDFDGISSDDPSAARRAFRAAEDASDPPELT